MTTPNTTDGGPAFPFGIMVERFDSYTGTRTTASSEKHQSGMTLRDYFAAAALNGILMNYTTEKFGISEASVAKCAYDYADAMLAARQKGRK